MAKTQITSLSFQQAYEALSKLVKDFEDENLDLEIAIDKYQQAADLSKYLQSKLTDMENQIKKIDIS